MTAEARDVPLLELQGIRAAYDAIEVLHGVDLVVPAGKVVALLGPNGAGKSTTLNVACGLMTPTAGKVLVAGRDVTGVAAEELARRGLITIPEGRGIFPNLTVRENLQMATYSGRPLDEVEEMTYRQFPRLGERRSQLAGSLSGGEQQMLAVARAMMSHPDLLLLDEPSLGLAPLIVQGLFQQLGSINKEQGVTMLVVEQNANLAFAIADRAYVLEAGEIALSGPADQLKNDDAVRRAYLGY